jgi:hypothetical protein
MKFFIPFFLCLNAWIAPVSEAAVRSRLEDQVVRLLVTKREVDHSAPWQKEDVTQQAFLAVVLPAGELLTTAYAVADAAFLEIQRFGSSHRDEAELIFVDYEADLALVRPVLPKVLLGMKPLPLGEDLPLDAHVDIYKVRDAYQLSYVPGTVQEVGVVMAATSTYTMMSYNLKVQQTGLGWAEPILANGKLVALTMGQDQNFLRAIPVSMIKHFLNDRHDQNYRGFPALGVELAPLISPDLRRMLHAGEGEQGVRVADVFAGGAASVGASNSGASTGEGKLQIDDVILSIDDQPVSDQGYVSHPLWGKVPLRLLLNQHFGGDALRLKILRQGRELSLVVNLTRFDSNKSPVFAYRYDQAEPHLIFGGFVFQELSQGYLRQWGKDWRDIAPIDLLYLFNSQNRPTVDGSQRIVFISRVLADPMNRGYSDIRHKRVATVNGKEVTSIASLRALLKSPVISDGVPYSRIKLGPEGDEVIIDHQNLNAAHSRIAKTYEIKSPASFFTP